LWGSPNIAQGSDPLNPGFEGSAILTIMGGFIQQPIEQHSFDEGGFIFRETSPRFSDYQSRAPGESFSTFRSRLQVPLGLGCEMA